MSPNEEPGLPFNSPDLKDMKFSDWRDPRKKVMTDEQRSEIARTFESEARGSCPYCGEHLRGPYEEILSHVEECSASLLNHEPTPKRTSSQIEQQLEGCGIVSCEVCGCMVRGTWTKYLNHLREKHGSG